MLRQCMSVPALLALLALCAVAQPDPKPQDGDIKLLRFDRQFVEGTGNVMVFHAGEWGYVCDDGWSLNNAHVVCHGLGYDHALGYTSQSHFGRPRSMRLWLDNVRCYGDEEYLLDCEAQDWGVNDCDNREAAGVFCAPLANGRSPQLLRNRPVKTTTQTTTTVTTTSTTPTPTYKPFVQVVEADDVGTVIQGEEPVDIFLPSVVNKRENDVLKASMRLQKQHMNDVPVVHFPQVYELQLQEGRTADEGRVEIRLGGGEWGVICSDHWSLLEARVVCAQVGKGYARTAMRGGFFAGENKIKMAAGIHCDGSESRLHECYHTEFRNHVTCSKTEYVAGVVCTQILPDLVPNATLYEQSSYLEDVPLYNLECAMEEKCASSSAYRIREQRHDWHVHRRRLLRFSSSTWNFGTADFRPLRGKGDWEWHQCHMHYHSMGVFASYDILDYAGNRVAEGHKASFCLEDVQCSTGVEKKYRCQGYGDQGISVGCADDYLHDIDCQWIDITDLPVGNYIFKVHINPGYLVAELRYDNNAVTCEMQYTGMAVHVEKCTLGEG